MSYQLQSPNVQYVIKHWNRLSNIEIAENLQLTPKTVTQIAYLIRKQGIKLPIKTTNRISLEERLWEKVKKTDTCWIWTGAKTKLGYGKIGGREWKNGWIGAHRAMWEIVNGEIPKGMVICHQCDNPSCVRPSHLFLGTREDNENDKIMKKRHLFGERHNLAKLKLEQVIQIKDEYAIGNVTQYQLAGKYNVSQTEINRIINNKRWAST